MADRLSVTSGIPPLTRSYVAGLAPEYRVGPLLLFVVAALSLFALRTPVENLLGTGAISARTTGERRIARLRQCALPYRPSPVLVP
jgi:hypothetical protein